MRAKIIAGIMGALFIILLFAYVSAFFGLAIYSVANGSTTPGFIAIAMFILPPAIGFGIYVGRDY